MGVTPTELLSDHTEPIRELAMALLEHIRKAAEWADERVYPGWHGVGFHHRERGYVVGVFPRSTDVRVLFEHGHLLGEAAHVEGTGQTRWVSFTEMDRARLDSIDRLLERALG